MESAPTRSWWMSLLQGVLTILFGLVAIAWPGMTLFWFVLLFGAYAVVSGITRVGASFANRHDSSWWLSVITGIAGVVAGIFTFAWPGLTGLLLLFVIGAYALVAGVMTIAEVITSWRIVRGKWLALFRGLTAIVFSILAFAWPGATALTLAWLIGIYAVLFGLSEIGSSLLSRRRRADTSACVES